MSVNINFDDCIGCGVCMQVCPSVFGLDENVGKVLLTDLGETDCGSDIIDLVKEAVDSCPVGCINE